MVRRACLSLAVIVSGCLSCISLLPAQATTAAMAAAVGGPQEGDEIAQAAPNQNYAVFHVNAAAGNDLQGDGTQLRPFKTIGHALRIAQPNTLILLAAGVYSPETGETFPLQLRAGVTVQGAAGPNAAAVAIVGSGRYVSPSQGLQSVAIIGANNAGLANLTVTNPQPGGTGLWIESGSPVIIENAFYHSGAFGIYIAGQGTPVIRNNYFSENGRVGLVIAGRSSAQVQGNIFENTGTGISVAPEATPQILDNRITRNQTGLVIHAAAHPVLQGNQVIQNRQNGILDYSPWDQPAIATQTIPAPPTVSSAGTTVQTEPPEEVIVQMESPAEVIDAEPIPTLAPSATAVPAMGASVAGGPPPSAAEPSSISVTSVPEPPAAEEARAPVAAIAAQPILDQTLSDHVLTAPAETLAATKLARVPPALSATTALSLLDLEALQSLPEQISLPAAEAAVADPVVVMERAVSTESSVTAAGVRTPSEGKSALTVATLRERLANRRAQSEAIAEPSRSSETLDAIDIPVIPPPADIATLPPEAFEPVSPSELSALAEPTEPLNAIPELPTLAANEAVATGDRVIVPNFEIPTGSGGAMPQLFTGSPGDPSAEGPPAPPSLATALGLPYRVFVSAENTALEQQVRQQVPDAFRVRVNGRMFMQAGAYPTFEEAQALAEQLNQQGLRAQIERIP